MMPSIPLENLVRALKRSSRAHWRIGLLAAALLGAATVALAQSISVSVPVVAFQTSSDSVSEDAGTYSIKVILSKASSDVVTVQYSVVGGTATSPKDYTIAAGTSGTVVFPSGATSQTIVVTLANDPVADGDENIFFTLSNPTKADLGRWSFTLTIRDTGTSTATVSFDSSTWTYNESDGWAPITVTMTGAPTSPVSVAYSTSDGTAKAGVNYVATSGTFTWQPSQAGTYQIIWISLIDDGTSGPTLTVNLTLSNSVNATLGTPSTAVLKLMDSTTVCSTP